MSPKFALITGGTRGLGRYLVERFYLEGYSLGVVARRSTDIQSLIEALPRRFKQVIRPLTCDLADPLAVSHLAENMRHIFPYLNVLINNAAIQGPIGPLSQNDMSEWRRTMQVNLFSPVVICQAAIKLPAPPGGAVIINLSGGGATGPRTNFSAYATAKAGLVRFSETLAEELKGDSIRVNCIAPGPMRTAMLEEVVEHANHAGMKEANLARDVLKNGGASMTRVADLALFLASDAGRGITGKLISAVWDKWEEWTAHLEELSASDVYTLRRITGRERGFTWGDK